MHDTITIRPTIPKAELQKVSGGNLSKWINGLIERAVVNAMPDGVSLWISRAAASNPRPMQSARPADEFCRHQLAGGDVPGKTFGTFDLTLLASAKLASATRVLSFDQTLKALAVAEGLEIVRALDEAGKALLARLKR